MKEFLEGVGEAFQKILTILSSPIVQLLLLGVVGLLVWRKIFGADKTVKDTFDETVDAAVSLPRGILSAADSALRGQNDSTYLSQDQARELARRRLAQKVLAGG